MTVVTAGAVHTAAVDTGVVDAIILDILIASLAAPAGFTYAFARTFETVGTWAVTGAKEPVQQPRTRRAIGAEKDRCAHIAKASFKPFIAGA